MDTLTFRRANRYGDEANGAAYIESEYSYVSPSEQFAEDNLLRSYAGTYNSHHTARGDSVNCDLFSMQRVMDMTGSLQREQEDREAREAVVDISEAERMRQVRDAQWEAVKARMSQRATSMHTVRAHDSEDDEEEVELRSGHTTLSASLNALVPSLSEERAMQSGGSCVVESMPERFCHFVYNWFMYFVYALSVSAVPGIDARKGADSREYFDFRVR
ncbi:hypothetical protein Q4I32_003105 [Leishmania shawi]|uniref:Transmembrane protein n=1 Tax=Leishmania shawi TaxID=5680 RepID=A0AAW3BY74_9TRYP